MNVSDNLDQAQVTQVEAGAKNEELVNQLIKKLMPLVIDRIEDMIKDALACKCCS
jgi:hypothetical protein